MSQDARADEEQAAQRRARILGLDYYDTSQPGDKPLFRDVLTVPELYDMKVVPIRLDQSNIFFGITTTTSQQTLTNIQQRFQDQRVAFAIISDWGFRDYMQLYDPPKQVVYHDISINQVSSEGMVEQISGMLEQVRADDMLAYLVAQAHRLNASDIHLETQPDYVRIRLRIDGVLHPVAHLNPEKYRVLVSAIASAGNVSTSANEAQQGHIAQEVTMADGNMVDVNVRLETVPTINGMDVVMRLFNMDASMYTLDRLGLSAQERQVVDDIIAKPTGLVMIVGPTGSGKTTTLYSMLNSLNTDERKIITIEDPVEYQFPGITQISVHSSEGGNDDSFADKLRAVLRLDPDIVMVGEIRDVDTSKTALQAALTGHLVLATFHAGSAAAALTRIADIIGQNPLFISAIRLVMAQRLIRRLDDKTKQGYSPSEGEWAKINEVLNTLPEGLERPNLEGLQLYKPGSSTDNPFGYEGQLAIREQFTMSEALRATLENSHISVTTQTLEEAAIKSGMLTMLQDGMLKVIAGQTTLDELYRVVG
ncbi:MAG TPA: ATPase, T2SS/T4P/T4SS family [Candidatus Saccharimonadales bacterium]|jgi:type II secretory ATPase GspE/PulE/Tfp pilus assembly ATPase PilB-like protein|nr:ATPase, T2SS/T4P/T4SS family [Candidatus Saccharimonadales bacterium]